MVQIRFHVARVGLTNFVQAWNAHRIPRVISPHLFHYFLPFNFFCLFVCFFTGKGIPDLLCGQGSPDKIPEDLLPAGELAADLYQLGVGTALTRNGVFGTDPFANEEAQQSAHS